MILFQDDSGAGGRTPTHEAHIGFHLVSLTQFNSYVKIIVSL